MKTLLSLVFSVVIGSLEIYYGVAKGVPVSWVLGSILVAIVLLVRFFRAVIGVYHAAFPDKLPMPKISPITQHESDSAFNSNKKTANSTKVTSNSFDDEQCSGSNGRGGYNDIVKEDDLFGIFL